MFPLHNLNGQVVGYSGRIFDEESNSKYINTKETYIFKKGEQIDNAKQKADENGVIILTTDKNSYWVASEFSKLQ